MSINTVTIMGRLTAAPELRTTQSGKSVTAFSIAVSRQYDKEKTDFIECVAWNKTAEFIERYFGKGDMIALTGRIETDTYKDKDGNNRKSFKIIVNEVSFCGGKSESSANTANSAYNQPSANNNFADVSDDFEEIIDDDDDLPF